MLAILTGESRIYRSLGTFYKSSNRPDIDDINPPEISRGLNIVGLPNQEIHLKVGPP